MGDEQVDLQKTKQAACGRADERSPRERDGRLGAAVGVPEELQILWGVGSEQGSTRKCRSRDSDKCLGDKRRTMTRRECGIRNEELKRYALIRNYELGIRN